MRWNKITAVLLLGLAGAACSSPPIGLRISNSAGGTNNLSINVYNGYPGPNRPNNANVNVKANRNVNAKTINSNNNAPRMHSANLLPPSTP